MAKSAAERQKEYRQRRPVAGDNGERRLQCWISTAAKLSLERLARHQGTSKRAVLEQLLVEADRATTDGMDDQVFSDYRDGVTDQTPEQVITQKYDAFLQEVKKAEDGQWQDVPYDLACDMIGELNNHLTQDLYIKGNRVTV